MSDHIDKFYMADLVRNAIAEYLYGEWENDTGSKVRVSQLDTEVRVKVTADDGTVDNFKITIQKVV